MHELFIKMGEQEVVFEFETLEELDDFFESMKITLGEDVIMERVGRYCPAFS